MLNVFDIVNYVLAGLMYFGVYAVLRHSAKVHMIFAMGLTIIGTAVYLTSNQAFPLLSLSSQYSAAISESQKAMLLAAGQYALTINSPVTFGTGTFWGYMFLYLGGMIISMSMLKSDLFGRWTAVIGIIANTFGLCYFFSAAFAPSLNILPALGSAPCNLVWYILTGLNLLKAGHSPAEK
jgi:Domain of unknown function (DUF4386)